MNSTGLAPCPICGVRRRLSDEDIIPIWARNHVMLLASFGPKEQRPRRVRMRICTNCNSRLGRTFEQSGSQLLKPMLHGSAVVLDRKAQLNVSCWIVKTCLLMTAMGLEENNPDRVLAFALIRRLLAERLPPVQTLIRIFMRRIDDGEASIEGPAAGPDPVQVPPTAFFSITSIGSLGWEMAVGSNWPILRYLSESSGRPGFLQIWPPKEPKVEWPPSPVITSEEIEALREAYLASSRSDSKPSILRWGGPEN
jgi:hypothetical protein